MNGSTNEILFRCSILDSEVMKYDPSKIIIQIASG